jgi:male germ cell-associated kinase
MRAEQIAFDDGGLFIVFEQMDMTLTQYIKRRKNLGEEEIRTLMK